MGQVESQPVAFGGLTPSDGTASITQQASSGSKGTSPPQQPFHPKPRKHASSVAENDAASQATASSARSSRVVRSPLSWAAAGVELVANTTADVALTTMNAALKTASVLAYTTEAAANVVANTTTNVALNTASVATQTASLITTATSVGAKTAGDAIAGTASLVVEGIASTAVPGTSPKHTLNREARTRSRSGDSGAAHSPQARSAFFPTTVPRPSQDFMLPEAMALGTTLRASSSHENLAETEHKTSMRNVGTRFWCMVGATNIQARKHWVATVTSSKPSAPSAKYLRKILTLAWETKGQSIDEYYKLLHMRPITTSPNCALKALITSLRIVREGPPEALSVSISNVGLVDAMGAAWAARVLLDVPTEESAGVVTVPGTPSMTPSANGRSLSPPMSATTAANNMMVQLLIARLSGLIVQKMHFHSRRHALNSRYEKVVLSPSMPATPGKPSSGGPANPLKDDDDEQDEWERNVQLSSALLTLLGTIEGVARLALGMGGHKNEPHETPSPTSLSLCTLLIEEALSAFDALSSALADVSNAQPKDQDATLVKSLMARYHETYQAMRAYCGVALQYPYVVALNKVPILTDEVSPLERGTVYSKLSSSGIQPVSPSSTAMTPTVGKGLTIVAQTAPSLAARPFTRRSILETLEEEEALESRLASEKMRQTEASEDAGGTLKAEHMSAKPKKALAVLEEVTDDAGMDKQLLLPLKEESLSSSSESAGKGRADGEPSSQQPQSTMFHMLFNPWEYSSNSVEHAKPPSFFCLETEEEDVSDLDLGKKEEEGDDDTYEEEEDEEVHSGGLVEMDIASAEEGVGGKTIRSRTLGNPFDTGNSSIILLAEAHRSAFSTISNPFASGQYNAFATNQVLSKHHLQGSVTVVQQQQHQQQQLATHKQREDATKRALEQCVRLFEFSGINLNQEDLIISKDILGRGAFSVVRRGTVKATGQEVAVKELVIEEWGRSPETILDFRAEVAVMKAVHHPNVLQLIGACTSPNLCLISEFCHRGNLFDLLYTDRAANASMSKVLNWQLRLRLALGEARGMHFLHTAFPAPLIHRDLKSLNLLLSKNWTLKVSDFGLSRFRRRGVAEGPCGTTQWMAPEVIQGKNYDESADVYSFGINLWELCTRRVPWEGCAPDQVKQRVVTGERPQVNETTLDSGCPPQLVVLMQRCWSQMPVDRPDFGTIVNELKALAKTL